MRTAATFLAFVATTTLVSSAPLSLTWVSDIGAAGTVCSSATGLCRSYVHLVFAATPSDVTNTLMGGGSYTVDGVEHAGKDAVFERHLVNGICVDNSAGEGECTRLGDSQMWNYGYEATTLYDGTSAPSLASEVCIDVWMKDTVDGTNATLSTRCVDMGEPSIVDGANTDGSVLTSLVGDYSTAATHVCSDASAKCRTNIHVVFTAATAEITNTMLSGGEYSLDGGLTWTGQGGTAYYEQHTDDSSGTMYQALQYDVDLLSAAGGTVPTQACFKVWVMDLATTEVAWLGDNGEAGTCIDVCDKLTYFHDYDGYMSACNSA